MAILALAAFGAACGTSSPKSGAPDTGRTSTTYASPTTVGNGNTPTSTMPTTTAPFSTPTAGLTSALTSVYQAETGALATYQNVVSRLGSVGPFPNVASSEEQHVSAIRSLFSHYGLPLPANSPGQESPATRTAACSLGVTLEQQVIALYSVQMPRVSAYADVTSVFQNLQAASRDNHLPAFQHCA